MGRRLLIQVLLFTLAIGSFVAVPVAADASTYQDPGGAFSFTLPDGWKADTSPDGVMFGDGVTTTLVLLKTRPANGSSLNDAFQQDLAPLTKDANLQGNPVSDLIVGGQPAKRTSFRTLDGFPILPGVITV